MCVQPTRFVMVIVRIRVLYLITIIKLEEWAICHYLGLGLEKMSCAEYNLYSYTYKYNHHLNELIGTNTISLWNLCCICVMVVLRNPLHPWHVEGKTSSPVFRLQFDVYAVVIWCLQRLLLPYPSLWVLYSCSFYSYVHFKCSRVIFTSQWCFCCRTLFEET